MLLSKPDYLFKINSLNNIQGLKYQKQYRWKGISRLFETRPFIQNQ